MTRSLQPGQTLLALAVLCLVGAFSEEANGQNGTVAGRVVDWSSSQPLAGVTITLAGPRSEDPRPTQTGPNGRFVLDGLQNGRYALRARADGYVPRPGGRSEGIIFFEAEQRPQMTRLHFVRDETLAV
jgi:hypothetical protein